MLSSAHKIVFATNNLNKLKEVQHKLGNRFKLVTPSDLGYYNDIPEDYETLEENALQKVRFIHERFHTDCFADDTGLEVDILNGAPGVYSARYAGNHKNSLDNIQKLLINLKGIANREAQFRTVISLIYKDKEYSFEGIVRGKLIETPRGSDGFGYDPIFVPNGFDMTFAEMDLSTKNTISHRAIAIERLAAFLLSV